jgi:hypothetical protein
MMQHDASQSLKHGMTMTSEAYLPEFLQPKRIDSLVRIGRANDGGYVVDSRSVENSDILIGLGINDDWSFEEDFYSRRRVPVVAFDGSVSRSVLVRRFVKALVQVHKPRKALSRFRAIQEYSTFFSDDRRHEEKVCRTQRPTRIRFTFSRYRAGKKGQATQYILQD